MVRAVCSYFLTRTIRGQTDVLAEAPTVEQMIAVVLTMTPEQLRSLQSPAVEVKAIRVCVQPPAKAPEVFDRIKMTPSAIQAVPTPLVAPPPPPPPTPVQTRTAVVEVPIPAPGSPPRVLVAPPIPKPKGARAIAREKAMAQLQDVQKEIDEIRARRKERGGTLVQADAARLSELMRIAKRGGSPETAEEAKAERTAASRERLDQLRAMRLEGKELTGAEEAEFNRLRMRFPPGGESAPEDVAGRLIWQLNELGQKNGGIHTPSVLSLEEEEYEED